MRQHTNDMLKQREIYCEKYSGATKMTPHEKYLRKRENDYNKQINPVQ